MNKVKATSKMLFILIITLTMSVACGGPAATQAPAAEAPATEAPATDPPATEAPLTEAPATDAPTEETTSDNLVVLLVVDAFSNERNPDTATNCAVIPDGQGYTGRESATISLGQPHGIFVYTDLISRQDLVTEVNASFVGRVIDGENFTGTDLRFTDEVSYPWIRRYDLFEFSETEKLLVVAVDTDGLNLVSIENNIRTALDEMSTKQIMLGEISLPPAQKFVINMSFVLVPCDPSSLLGFEVEAERNTYYEYGDKYEEINNIPVLQNLRGRLESLYNDYSASDLELLQEQLQTQAQAQLSDEYVTNILELIELPEEEKSQLIRELIDEAIFQAYIVYSIYNSANNREWQDDSFYSTLSDYFSTSGLEIIYVGAAGNFMAEFPYAPASWDFVDSISSSGEEQESNTPTNEPSLAVYSNWGEVQMDGVYPFSSEIVGTSFAAPKFSYQIAHYLLAEDSESSCAGSSPALGYATKKDPVFLDFSDSPMTDNNLAYDVAMATYCP